MIFSFFNFRPLSYALRPAGGQPPLSGGGLPTHWARGGGVRADIDLVELSPSRDGFLTDLTDALNPSLRLRF